MTNDHGVRVDGRIVQLGDFQWMAESSCFAEGFAAHIRKAIEDARSKALDEAIAEVRRSTGLSLRAIGGQIEQLKERDDAT